MTVTEQEIFDAFNTQLEALPNFDAANTAFLGRSYVPQAETAYLATSMPALGSRMLTTGQNGVTQWEGTYQVLCNWPIGLGLENCTQQRDAVRALFPNGLTLTTANGFLIRCQRASAKPILQDGAWLRGPVQVQWFLQEVV